MSHSMGHSSLVEKLKQEINESYATITITELSRKVATNVHSMRKLFKQATGMTIPAYRQLIRMNKAKELLLQTKNDLLTVSDKCGYENKNSFSKAFKKQFGITPTAFAMQSLNNVENTNTLQK